MGFESSIKATFGGDLSKLRESFQEARAEATKLNESMGGRAAHRLVGGIIGAEALNKLKEFAGEAIKDAQRIRDEFEKVGKPVDSDVQALADLGDGLKDIHEGAVKAVGFLVGGFSQLGELIGSSINRLRGVSEAQENLAKSSERAAEEQEKALKKLKDANSPEKLAAAEKRLDDARHRALMARMSDEGKVVLLMGDEDKLQKELAEHAGDTVQNKEIQAKLEDTIAQREALQASIKRKDSEEEKRHVDEMNRVAEEGSKLEQRKYEAKLDQMTAEDRLLALTRDESELKRAIATVGEKTATGIEFGNELLDVQAKLRETNLEITEKQARAEAEVAKGLEHQKDVQTALGGTSRTSKQFGNASDAELKELLRRDKGQVLALGQKQDLGSQISRGSTQFEVGNIEQELKFRSKFQSRLAHGGVEAARRDFQGDPLQFDKLVEQFSKQRDNSDRMLTELQKVNGNLSDLFRNQ